MPAPTFLTRLLRRDPPHSVMRPLYAAVIRTGRQPHWYVEGAVPDTMDGRFDIILAILSQVLMRLDSIGAHQAAAWLTELFVEDMDGQLRQEGIGDVVVGKHIGRMVSALGGRMTAYRAALIDDVDLESALRRNLYRGVAVDNDALTHVADRLRALWDRLKQLDDSQLMAGELG